nr:hypothetical protein [Tanacetum cinerariifolium]
MESDRWPQIYAAIKQHLQKLYNGKKAALKERYWVPEEDETYDVEASDADMESSATREYLWLIHTFFLTHTVGGVFLNPTNKALYGVPYTEDEIIVIVRGDKQRGNIPSVGRVLPEQGMVIPPLPPCTHSSNVAKLNKREKLLTKNMNMFMKLFKSDDKFSQMLS